MDAPEDEREEEISTLTAIFPELILDPSNPFVISLGLPTDPSNPLPVRFREAPPPSPPASDNECSHHLPAVQETPHTQQLDHLPPLLIRITLPEGYPADTAPEVALSTTPQWLSDTKLKELEGECEKLWEEYGHCQILYSYIDFLQQATERAFDLESDGIDVSASLKPALVDYNTLTKKAIFNSGTFDCGICLEPKKGSSCYRMLRCNHVFCLTCLQDFYNNCITEGDVGRVQCLDPTCGKDAPVGQRKSKKLKTLHPRELLEMGIEESMVRRYVDMKRKKKLEADKTTVYCPRTWCQGPARSDKYPPIPQDLSLYPDSASEDEEGDEKSQDNKKEHGGKKDRLAVCSKCSLAFCTTCYAGWHGDFARCWPRNPAELSEEEKASYDYIRSHTSPCPTCDSPTQKTMGCNHMRCFQCATHFCYLCGAWLDPENPYLHFNKGGTDCYQKLWELEEGDEGQGGQFQGARRWEQEAIAVAEAADREEAEQLQREEDERAARELAAQDDAQVRNPAQQLAQLPEQVDEATAAAFRRFVDLAVRDEEDGWDSDELEGDDDERWRIRAR